MSYKSKRILTSMISGILLLIAYIIYALGKNSTGTENLKSWAMVMLVFIGIAILAVIVVQIVFHIIFSIVIAVRERACDDKKIERIISSSMLEDEMDKLISLKSTQIGYMCAGIGFIVALIALACGVSAVIALHIILGTFFLGSIVEGCISIYCYESGISNG